MLQAIRDRLIGWVLWLMIGIICVPFAFWGIQSIGSGGGDPVVAKVGGWFGGLVGAERITESQLRAQYERRYQQLQMMMGDNFRADQVDPKQFREIVLRDMIQEITLRQYSDKAGYAASDSALVQAVREIPMFQGKDGQFDVDVYHQRLSERGYSTARFETEMRNSLAIEQMRSGVVETAFATDADLAETYRVAGQQRTLSYAQFEVSKYAPNVKIEDAQVQAQYDKKKSQFMTPERIKLAYVELSLEAMPKAANPGDDVLKVMYEAEKATRFSTTEERHARHILIGVAKDADAATKAAAQKRAEEIAAKLKAGADFAQLARSESTDPGSKDKGGDLGWVKKGQMVPKFEQALFALQKGEVSGPVETDFGYHIIKLDDVHPSTVQPFEDKAVQAELLDAYQKKEGEKHFAEQQEKIEQLAFENPTSLDAVAKALNLEVKTTDWFGRGGGTGIAANNAVKEAAFSPEVFSSNENSKPISIGPGDVVVVRKAEYEAPRQKELKEVADDIRNELRNQAAKDEAIKQAQAMLNLVREGKKPEEAAKQSGVELKSAGAIKRDDAKIDRAIIRVLFHLPRPQGDKPSFEQVVLGNGDVAAVFLSEVKDGDLASASAEDVKRLRQQLRDKDAGEEFKAFRDHISNTVKVKQLRSAAEVPDNAPAQ
ncbi:MAG TPA: SurA N-terminal domain-containing protein [Nevskiaceae bacterium]|nr:SurA N-terminal domain-containing protein [Nevskiaceae bacterium]